MFKIRREKGLVIISISGEDMCWYDEDLGRRDLDKKIEDLKKRGLIEG